MRDFSDTVTWVVVADGAKALICRNDDTDLHPLLSILTAEQIENPPTREQGTGRPGRMNDGRAGGARKSAFDDSDWHQIGEDRFAKEITDKLNRAAINNDFDRIVIFAPPKTLGVMRPHFHRELEKRIAAQVDRDLTNHPIEEVEKQTAIALAN